jgi:non-lysosomal glucosylceramidase
MPLGGIGAGQIALGDGGGLRQWQIVNQIYHVAFVPGSFFAIRTTTTEPPLDVIRILQPSEVLDREEDPTPLVTDDFFPQDQRDLLTQFPGVERTTFQGPYPFARVAYEDDELPVELSLEAYSPFVPLDAHQRGLPAIVFTFTVRNLLNRQLNALIGGPLQHVAGFP